MNPTHNQLPITLTTVQPLKLPNTLITIPFDVHFTDPNYIEKMKENVDFGDNIRHKPDDCICIYFQNINGIYTENSWSHFESSVNLQAQFQIDIAGLVETNIFWTPKSRRSINRILRTQNHKIHSTISNSNEIPESVFQPGGTVTITNGTLVNHILGTDNDPTDLGRWTGIHLHGQGNRTIAIITAYCPRKTGGNTTCHSQQLRLLQKQLNKIDIDPRAIMITDLTKHIQKLRANHIEVIIQWDANNSVDSKELQQFLQNKN